MLRINLLFKILNMKKLFNTLIIFVREYYNMINKKVVLNKELN